jgi:hypothetical protein
MQLHVGVPTAQHCEAGSEITGKRTVRWCVNYAEQKYIQNHPLKIRVRNIRGGANYASKYGIYQSTRRNTAEDSKLHLKRNVNFVNVHCFQYIRLLLKSLRLTI